MKAFNENQIACLKDAIGTGKLMRHQVPGDFAGELIHDANTVYSLINKECFDVVAKSPYGYPIAVKPNISHPVVIEMPVLEKELWFPYRNKIDFCVIKINGIGWKDGKVYIKYDAGANSFRYAPIEKIRHLIKEKNTVKVFVSPCACGQPNIPANVLLTAVEDNPGALFYACSACGKAIGRWSDREIAFVSQEQVEKNLIYIINLD